MNVGSDNINKYFLARDYCQVMPCNTEATTSINFVLDTEQERANDATCSTILRLINNVFSSNGVSAMSNHAQIHMNRGCCVHAVLYFY